MNIQQDRPVFYIKDNPKCVLIHRYFLRLILIINEIRRITDKHVKNAC